MTRCPIVRPSRFFPGRVHECRTARLLPDAAAAVELRLAEGAARVELEELGDDLRWRPIAELRLDGPGVLTLPLPAGLVRNAWACVRALVEVLGRAPASLIVEGVGA